MNFLSRATTPVKVAGQETILRYAFPIFPSQVECKLRKCHAPRSSDPSNTAQTPFCSFEPQVIILSILKGSACTNEMLLSTSCVSIPFGN